MFLYRRGGSIIRPRAGFRSLSLNPSLQYIAKGLLSPASREDGKFFFQLNIEDSRDLVLYKMTFVHVKFNLGHIHDYLA